MCKPRQAFRLRHLDHSSEFEKNFSGTYQIDAQLSRKKFLQMKCELCGLLSCMFCIMKVLQTIFCYFMSFILRVPNYSAGYYKVGLTYKYL